VLKQSIDRRNRSCLDRDEKAWEATMNTGATQREDRPMYGCVGADRPEAQPYIDDIDGILYYTCPAFREELKGIFPTLGRAQ
jgi:hypothetical protein